MLIEDLTSKAGQRKIAKISLTIAVIVSAIAFLIDLDSLATGVMFGTILMVINLWAMSYAPRLYDYLQKKIGPDCSKAAAGCFYYLRFLIFILIMYIAVSNSEYNFGIGCFIGFLIPKFSMGFVVISGKGEDWWLQRETPAETIPGPEKNLSPLEKELTRTNPFQFDVVEWEMKNTVKKT